MKIKDVIGDLKIKFFFNLKNDYNKNISRTFSGAVVDSVGSVHFQIFSSLVQLVLLKVYRPLPMESVLTTGF